MKKALVLALVLFCCAGWWWWNDPDPVGLSLLSIHANNDRAALEDALRVDHYQVRRMLDSLCNASIAARAAGDHRQADSLTPALAWLTETYLNITNLSDMSRRYRLLADWSPDEITSKRSYDSTFSELDKTKRLRRRNREPFPEYLPQLRQLHSDYLGLGDTTAVARVDYTLAESFFAIGEHDSTSVWLERSRAFALAVEDLDRAGYGDLLESRLLTLNEADYFKSEKTLMTAGERFQRVGNYRRLADVRVAQAYNATLLFQTDKAIDGYQAGYAACTKYGDPRLQGYCLYMLGASFYIEGELDSAALYATLARQRRQDLADKYPELTIDVACTESGLGLIAQARGDDGEAARRYILADEMLVACENIEMLCTNRLRHGSLLITRRDYDGARDKFRFILDNSDRFENSINAQFGLAVCDYYQGAIEAAEANLRRCIHRQEISQSKLPIPELRSGMLWDKLVYYQLLACVFLDRYERTQDISWADSAFAYVEASKAMALEDMLRTGTPDAGSETEQRLIAAISALENELLLGRGDRSEQTQTIAVLEDSLHSERVRSAPTKDPTLARPETKRLTREDAQRLIVSDSAAILAYMISEFGSCIFLLTDSAFEVRRITTPVDQLNATIDGFLDVIATFPREGRLDGDWRSFGRWLYDDLIPEETLTRLGTRCLTIIGGGRLHYLPFETLIGPDDAYLVEPYDITYAPSVATLARLRDRAVPRHRANRVIAFADPAYADDDLVPLTYSRDEAESLARLFGPEQASVYVGQDATERAFCNQDYRTARYVHVASHGICNERRPDRSALVLAGSSDQPGSGLLHRDEIRNLEMPVDLVFLSACRSGAGRSYPGEGVLSLAQPFLISGAGSVIAGYWNINDRAAVDLVTSFYSELNRGSSKARALAQAKRAMIQSDRALYRHPYFWAPFVLIGDTD